MLYEDNIMYRTFVLSNFYERSSSVTIDKFLCQAIFLVLCKVSTLSTFLAYSSSKHLNSLNFAENSEKNRVETKNERSTMENEVVEKIDRRSISRRLRENFIDRIGFLPENV